MKNAFYRLFPKDSDEVIDYQGERTMEGLSKFVDSNGKEAGNIPEEVCFHIKQYLFDKKSTFFFFILDRRRNRRS